MGRDGGGTRTGRSAEHLEPASVSPARVGRGLGLALPLLFYRLCTGEEERHRLANVYLLTEESVYCTFLSKKKGTEQYVHCNTTKNKDVCVLYAQYKCLRKTHTELFKVV